MSKNDKPVVEQNVPLHADTTLQQERSRAPTHEMRAYDVWDEESLHAVEDTPWVAPASLATPPARDGLVQRWIRVGSMGVDDPTNAARKTREGWRPRPADTVPGGFSLPTISHGKWAGCIGVEGMILCEMPERMYARRSEAIKNKTDVITNTLESELQQQSHSAMPITQSRTSKVVREVMPAAD